MAELDDWIISSTGSELGGEKLDFGAVENWNIDMEKALRDKYISSVGVNPWGAAGDYSDAQWASHQTFMGKIGYSGAEFGDAFYNAGANEQKLTAVGYKPPTTDKAAQYTEQYGTDFTQEQISGALTGRYGEVQDAVDLGKGWSDLYSTVKEWDAQDDEWLKLANEAQGLTAGAKSEQRASMAAGGMKSGSTQWQRNQNRIDEARIDVGAEREEKRQALQSTSVYQALEDEYKKRYMDEEVRAKGESVTKYKDVLVNEGYLRPAYTDSIQIYDSETGQTTFEDRYNPEKWIDPVYGQEAYQEWEETTTKTGDMLYGTGEDRQGIASFDDFYTQNFGEYDSSDASWGKDISNVEETEDERRARVSASGAGI